MIKKLDLTMGEFYPEFTKHNFLQVCRKVNELIGYLQAKEEAIRETNEALCKWKAHIINSEEASKGEEK